MTDTATRTDPTPHTGDDVVLLDAAGAPAGRAPRLSVHGSDTPLHLAFSVHVMDGEGRVLLTRRALSKRTWPGVWTNSCCGHPRPGEDPGQAVTRRVREELGLRVVDVESALPDFRYRAVDASGVVENEVCPVYVARAAGPVVPDPAEVLEYAWVDWVDYAAAVAATPVVFSPWSVLQVPDLHRRLVGTPMGAALGIGCGRADLAPPGGAAGPAEPSSAEFAATPVVSR